MKTRQTLRRALSCLLMVFLAAPPLLIAQQSGQAPVFKPEELEQILAPIALYPDSLVAQILMASTYPLEVVQADRFAKQNASLKGEALTKALEAQKLGSERQVAGQFSPGADDDEREARMDAETGRRFSRAAKAGHGYHPESARQGASGRQSQDDQRTDRHRRRKNHQDRACQSAGGLRAELQSHGGIRRLAVPDLPALFLLSARICSYVDVCVRRGCRDGRGVGLCLG